MVHNEETTKRVGEKRGLLEVLKKTIGTSWDVGYTNIVPCKMLMQAYLKRKEENMNERYRQY